MATLTSLGIIHATGFGCVGDGTTNNDTALAAMKAVMLADVTKTWHIIFEPGHYCYQNNRWLFGVLRFILDAYGCTFECNTTNVWEINGRPLNGNDPFDDRGDVARTGANDVFVNGDRFDSADAGDSTITLTTADPAGFAVGERVLLHGYDQQFDGYPPNLRYFEWKEVLSVDTGADTITFTTPLIFNYDDRWPDTTDGLGITNGKPRVLSLERTNYTHARFIHIRGATFLPNPVTGFNAFLLSADMVILEDVTADEFWLSMSDVVICKRIHSTLASNGVKPDKVVSSVSFEDCVIREGLREGTGVHRISVRRCQISGEINVIPRILSIDECDVYSTTTAQYGIYVNNGSVSLYAISVGATRFHNLAPATLLHAMNTGQAKVITVGSVSGTNILIPWDAAGQDVLIKVDYGSVLRRTGNLGEVTAIYHDGGSPGNLVLEGTWTTPTAAQTFTMNSVEKIADRGGNSVVGTQVPIWRDPTWIYPDFTDDTTAAAGGVKLGEQYRTGSAIKIRVA